MIDRVVAATEEARQLYHRLVLLVGTRGSGKTRVLREVAKRLPAPYVNVGVELSRRLLDMTGTQRTLAVRQALDDVLAEAGGEVAVLDNTDVLFTPTLRQNAAQLLKLLSRSRTVVAAWNGGCSQGWVTRAVPGHSEYVRERAEGIMIVNAVEEHNGPQP